LVESTTWIFLLCFSSNKKNFFSYYKALWSSLLKIGCLSESSVMIVVTKGNKLLCTKDRKKFEQQFCWKWPRQQFVPYHTLCLRCGFKASHAFNAATNKNKYFWWFAWEFGFDK